MRESERRLKEGMRVVAVSVCNLVLDEPTWLTMISSPRTPVGVCGCVGVSVSVCVGAYTAALGKKYDHPKTRYYYGLMLQNQRNDPAAAGVRSKACSKLHIRY
jgi:hypothetical protein